MAANEHLMGQCSGLPDLRGIADKLGLVSLRDEHLVDLATAMRAAASWQAELSEDPPVDVEPDHIDRVAPDRERT